MGLLTRIALLPLAPAEGVVWLARQLQEEAMRELYSPDRIRAELAELEQALERGELSEEDFAASEEILLDRLDAAREYQAGEQEGP